MNIPVWANRHCAGRELFGLEVKALRWRPLCGLDPVSMERSCTRREDEERLS